MVHEVVRANFGFGFDDLGRNQSRITARRSIDLAQSQCFNTLEYQGEIDEAQRAGRRRYRRGTEYRRGDRQVVGHGRGLGRGGRFRPWARRRGGGRDR